MTAIDIQPLKWPEGWSRTLLSERRPRAHWKKTYSYYREQVVKELERLGANRVEISRHSSDKERLDPGVAVWFSLKLHEDFSWQTGLQLDSPMPTLEEIDRAFKRLAANHHPDRVAQGSGGDVQMFLRLQDYRTQARSWVLGHTEHIMDNCIPCDRFTEARMNLAGIASALRHFRGLENLGIPAILERIMDKTFKTALTGTGTTGGSSGSTAA